MHHLTALHRRLESQSRASVWKVSISLAVLVLTSSIPLLSWALVWAMEHTRLSLLAPSCQRLCGLAYRVERFEEREDRLRNRSVRCELAIYRCERTRIRVGKKRGAVRTNRFMDQHRAGCF